VGDSIAGCGRKQANRRKPADPPAAQLQWHLGAICMAHTVYCVRYKKEMEGLDEPPFDSEFGQKIYKNVSKAAWDEWLNHQKMLLNEYRLQPWLPQAQQFLVEQMEQFFFGAGSSLPSEFVPPGH
jgi:Fe-S cluster biosynthesis and repair protein YggX